MGITRGCRIKRNLVHEVWLLLPLFIMAALHLPPARAEIDPNLLKYNYNAAGSVDRHVFDKAMETVSVEDFNAVGDGTTDDTAAIQNAINYAAARGGGYVKFPVGEYRISTSLTVSGNGVVLIGEGYTVNTSADCASTIINSSTTADAVSITGNYAGVENLAIKSGVTATGGSAVKIDNCEGGFVSKVHIESAFNGITLYRTRYASVQDVTLKDIIGTYGIKSFGVSGNPSHQTLIRTLDCSAPSSNTTTQWIAIGDYCYYAQIHRVRTEEGGRGLIFDSADAASAPQRTQVAAFVCVSPYNEGIFLVRSIFAQMYDINIESSDTAHGIAAGSNSSGLQIANVRVYNCYQDGFRIDGSDNIYISNPTIGNNSTYGSGICNGVGIYNDADNITITGGKIGQLYSAANNQGYGVLISNSTQNAIAIHGVTVNGNVYGGISDASSNATRWLRNNPGADNKPDGVIPFYVSGTVSNAAYLCQRVFGQRIKILGFTAKLAGGTCSITLSESGTNQTGSVAVGSTLVNYTYSSPAVINAVASGKRLEVKVSGASSANTLEGAFYYVNLR